MERRKYFSIVIFYIFILLVIQEILFRFLFPLPEVSNFNRVNYSPLQDNILAQRKMFVRNTCFTVSSSPDNAEFKSHLNLYGFRDKQWEIKKNKNKKRIIFIGDSQMEGALCADDQTIPYLFQQVADKNNIAVEAMNLGVMGANLYEYIRLINDAVPVFQPDYVVLLIYSNDLINQYLPHNNPQTQPIPKPFVIEKYNWWLPRIAQLFFQIIKKEPIAFRWCLKAHPYFPPVPAPNNPWTTQEQNLKRFVTPDIAEAMKQGKFGSGAVNMFGWKNIFLKEAITLLPELSFLKQNLTGLKDLSGWSPQLLGAYLPDRHQVTNYYQPFDKKCCLACPDTLDLTDEQHQIGRKLIEANCSELKIPFLDLTPFIKAEEDKGNHLFWNYDEHLRAKGNELVGEKLWEGFRQVIGNR